MYSFPGIYSATGIAKRPTQKTFPFLVVVRLAAQRLPYLFSCILVLPPGASANANSLRRLRYAIARY